MKYQSYLGLESLRKSRKLSERRLGFEAGLSRSCLRQISAGAEPVTLQSIIKLAEFFDRKVNVVLTPKKRCFSEYSTIAVAMKVQQAGFESWKLHFMELVDEFRRTLDARLILLPPPKDLEARLTALLASIVRTLCFEAKMDTPEWAARRYFLESPWFVSGIEALKASALLESPMAFRTNNIFVQDNFLSRA